MIELVFLACLRSEPDLCRERAIRFVPAANPAFCAIQAQPELASWANDHPDQAISRWWCEDSARKAARTTP